MPSRRPSPALTLPRLEADGQTHTRDCECPRCDAGWRPSEGQRAGAARRWQEQQEREAAAAALDRKRARDRMRALRLTLSLEEEERRTDARLREEAALAARLRKDARLAALLAIRRAGLPPADAVEETERRFPPRASDGGNRGQEGTPAARGGRAASRR
jgi:hypothetical protein